MAPQPPGSCTASLVLVQSAVTLIRSPASSLVPLPTCLGLKTSFAKTWLWIYQYVCLALLDWRIFLILDSIQDFKKSLAFKTFLFSQGSGCGGLKDLVGTEGMLASMDHPESYNNRASCQWNIRVPTEKNIYLHLSNFSLEETTLCFNDEVTLSDNVGTLGT